MYSFHYLIVCERQNSQKSGHRITRYDDHFGNLHCVMERRFLLIHSFQFHVSKNFIFFHQSRLLNGKSLKDGQFRQGVHQFHQNIAALLF